MEINESQWKSMEIYENQSKAVKISEGPPSPLPKLNHTNMGPRGGPGEGKNGQKIKKWVQNEKFI